jgi:hypothetical protein
MSFTLVSEGRNLLSVPLLKFETKLVIYVNKQQKIQMRPYIYIHIQGGSNMTWTICV